MLKPALARGELRAIGATTLDEYRKYIEKDAALERRFQTVLVSEPTVEDTIAILRGLKEKYEIHHGVRITDGAIVAAAELSDRYITDRFLPDKAIDLMDEAASRLRIEIDSMPEEVDAAERKLIQMQIEEQALMKETDMASQERLEKLRRDIAAAQEDLDSRRLSGRTRRTPSSTCRTSRPSWKALSLMRSAPPARATCCSLPRSATRAFPSCSSSCTWPRKP